mmetsp:Transcript_694/g.1601  ORF Transcript_694/g.1601 Transcript_694/m.1601 type:complete len:96 (-) Transcript_694:358-645(-)
MKLMRQRLQKICIFTVAVEVKHNPARHTRGPAIQKYAPGNAHSRRCRIAAIVPEAPCRKPAVALTTPFSVRPFWKEEAEPSRMVDPGFQVRVKLA